MFPLVSCHAIRKSFGTRALFDNLSFVLSEGQRMGLIGPNGSGKSTLAKILAGLEEPDSGTRSVRKKARLTYVAQDSIYEPGQSVRQVLLGAMSEMEGETAEEKAVEIEVQADRSGFEDLDVDASTLSGGWKKRLAITCAMVQRPDVLILDEPTNHLDLDGIFWLEKLLTSSAAASLVITHDRYFLETVATHMAEINRTYPDGIFPCDGNYSKFLERREEFYEAEAKRESGLRNRVGREIEWLRRGPKARTTKSKARIDNAEDLISQLAEMQSRARTSTANIDFTGSERKTKKLIVGEGLAMAFDQRQLFSGINVTLTSGMRLGLSGANGSGKTTLLKLLRGDFPPTAGTVERADNLRIVTLDQTRSMGDEKLTLKEALAPDGDSVIFRDRVIHVNAWAKRFLFSNDSLVQPVANLSGGERARVLVARLMLQPADVLFLDEPTNDLDIPTLEVLEENLADFPGAIVLVTHDRYLLDRVSNAVLGLDGYGGATLFAEYAQFEQSLLNKRPPAKDKTEAKSLASEVAAPKKKLSYIEQREFDGMEKRIHEAETHLEQVQHALAAPEAISNPELLQKYSAQLSAAQTVVDEMYARWAALEAKLI